MLKGVHSRSNIKKRKPMSEETKKKIGDANRGRKRPDMIGNKYVLGIKHTHEQNKAKSEMMMGEQRSLGMIHTDEAKKRIGEASKGNQYCLGYKHSQEVKNAKRIASYGKNNPNWKGGITPDNLKIRQSFEYKAWRTEVYKRDDYTCNDCGQVGGELNAHHLLDFALYPDFRFCKENGLTLCKECHKKIHKAQSKENRRLLCRL